MQKRNLLVALAVMLSNCVRSPSPPPAPLAEDRSIVFPQFFEQEPVDVGAHGRAYELDGEMLRAITIAANDFLPPGRERPECWNQQQAQRYRVIRQGDIIFVDIRGDHAYCGFASPALDSGAKYAIGADGRILRRVMDGQPEDPTPSLDQDAGPRGEPAMPGVPPGYDAIWNPPPSPEPQDAGPAVVPDGGTEEAPSGLDGGQ